MSELTSDEVAPILQGLLNFFQIARAAMAVTQSPRCAFNFLPVEGLLGGPGGPYADCSPL